VLALDISREYYELGLPMIEKAGVTSKIDFREGPALPLLDQLLQDVRVFALFATNLISFILSMYNLKNRINL
jgi:caffeoyl-CoA O-methyltransferase